MEELPLCAATALECPLSGELSTHKKDNVRIFLPRFICGTQNIHKQLEEKIARFKDLEVSNIQQAGKIISDLVMHFDE